VIDRARKGIGSDDAIIVPAGARLNVINKGEKNLEALTYLRAARPTRMVKFGPPGLKPKWAKSILAAPPRDSA